MNRRSFFGLLLAPVMAKPEISPLDLKYLTETITFIVTSSGSSTIAVSYENYCAI